MLELVVGGIALAGIAWLVGSVSEEEERAHKNWQNKRAQVKRSLEEHRSNITEHIKNAQHSYDFHKLVDLHYSSRIVADSAYSLLKDSERSISGVNKMLKDAKQERTRLQRNLDIAKEQKNKKDIYKIIEELKVVNSMRKGLFDERDKLQVQRDSFKSELNKFNLETGKLRDTIKDCSSQGRDWYERLEERKRQKRLT